MEELKNAGPDPLGQEIKQLHEAQHTQRKRVKKSPVAELLIDHGKVPPQAVDLEEAVLGAMMLEKDPLTEVIEILNRKSSIKRLIRSSLLLSRNYLQAMNLLIF